MESGFENKFLQLSGIKVSPEIEKELSSIPMLAKGYNLLLNGSDVSPRQCVGRILSLAPSVDPVLHYGDKAILEKALQCAKWAQELWQTSLKGKKIGRPLVAYLVAGYLGYPDSILDWNLSPDVRKRLSTGFDLEKIEFSISDTANYASRIARRDYDEGKREQDAIKLTRVFQELYRGIGFNQYGTMVPELIRFAHKLHPAGILKLLNLQEPYVTDLVCLSLDRDSLSSLLENEYREPNPFAYTRGFILLCTQLKDTRSTDESVRFLYDRCASIFLKILGGKGVHSNLRALVDVGNLRWNPVFHYSCGVAVSSFSSLVEEYTSIVEFSLEEYYYGDDFYRGVVKHNNEVLLGEISKSITKHYWEFLSSLKHHVPLNRATGYFNFILYYVQSQCTTPEAYSKELALGWEEIFDTADSWNPGDVMLKLRKLFLFVASNFVLKHKLSADDTALSFTKQFVNDERNRNCLAPVSPDKFIQLLTEPEVIEQLEMEFENGDKAQINRS